MLGFIIVAILFGITAGSFIGAIFTVGAKGWRKIIGMIVAMLITGCIISGAVTMEYQVDKELWNNGYCAETGTKWVFANADTAGKNSSTVYYWYCPENGRILKLHSQFE